MMRRLRGALAALKTEETGLSLPEVMVAVIVNTVSVSIIAASIMGFTTLQTAFAGSATAARESSVTELRWRSDLREAVKTTPLNATSVTFSVAGSARNCIERTWSFVAAGAVTALQIATRSFAGTPSASGCSGAPSAVQTSVAITDAGPASAFTFVNVGGRTITFVAATARLDSTSIKPLAASDFDWAATAVALATLNTATRASTVHRAPLVVAQSLATQAATAAVADAPMKYVAP